MDFIYAQLFTILQLTTIIFLETLFLYLTINMNNKYIQNLTYFVHVPIGLLMSTILILQLIMPDLTSGMLLLLIVMKKLINIYIVQGFVMVLIFFVYFVRYNALQINRSKIKDGERHV